ncbi:MAG: hypothetical protein RBR32_03650 [Bacteroidales bacterium]|nr:hypothetical protein [Bacteroidales bacterium]
MAVKNTMIQMRISTRMKQLASERAKEKGKTLSGYIMYLIKKDMRKNREE